MKPETRLVTKIMRELKAYCLVEKQGYFIKIHGSAYQVSGIPDIVGVYRGRFVAFEVKTDTGALSRRQVLIMLRIKKAGGIANVITNAPEAMIVIYRLDADENNQ